MIGDSYTTGSDLGGLGPKGWTCPRLGRAGRTGYRHRRCGRRGRSGIRHARRPGQRVRGSDRPDGQARRRRSWCSSARATTRASTPSQLSVLAYGTFQLARRIAPSATFLVIGPPWPTADPPPPSCGSATRCSYQAEMAGATFVDPIAERWFVGRPESDRRRRRAPDRCRTTNTWRTRSRR